MTDAGKDMRSPLKSASSTPALDSCPSSNGRLITMKKLLILTLFTSCLALTPPARSQGTFTAASCNQSDVNAVINGPTHKAVDGDTIKIPAGSCTWTGGVTVPNGIGISIIGSGTPNSSPSSSGAGTVNTILTGGQITMSPTFGNQLSRISLINFKPGSGAPVTVNGTCTSNGCPNLRLDNLIFPTSWEKVDALGRLCRERVKRIWGSRSQYSWRCRSDCQLPRLS